jgi:lipopolysaccharide transport system permease protein
LAFPSKLYFFWAIFASINFLIPTEEFFHMTWAMLLLPILIPLVASLGLGMGLWMSVLTAKYRDFNQITGFLAQALMYATPIIYPLSEIPEKYRFWASFKPHGSSGRNISFCLVGQRFFFRSPPHLFRE